jgi:hypothetical protein
LLDNLKGDGFDHWSDRLFTFRAAFFTGARLGLALATVFASAALRALPRAVAAFRFGVFDCFLRLAMISPILVDAPQRMMPDHQVPATKQSSYQQIVL